MRAPTLAMNRKRYFFVILFCLSVSGGVAAEPQTLGLTINALIKSIKQHHPVIKSAQARREQAELETQRAEGAFDLRIQQSTLSRVGGFYDGQYLDQSITQPFEFGGVEVSAGYRISDGSFPVYEDFYNTQTAGEARIGVKFPLLRGRETDERRTALLNAGSLKALGLTEEQVTVNRFLYEGVNAYINWYQAYQRTQARSALVVLAQQRRAGIQERVANGDLAAITITEFETTLLSRQITLRESEQALLQSQQRLLFYLQGQEGESFNLQQLRLPVQPIEWPFGDYKFDMTWQQSIIRNHPSLQALDEKLLLARNQARLADNNLLPELDLEVKVSRDMGTGSTTLDQPETYVGLSFSVPLQRNRAKADQQTANARMRELTLLREAQVDRLQLQLNENLLQLNTFDQLRGLRRQQAAIAKQLENQEHARFDAGDSDQFLLNAREAQAGQAELEAINAEVTWLRQQLNLVNLSFALLEL